MSFPRLRSEDTEQHHQPQTATGQAERQRAPGARLSSPSLLPAAGLGFFWCGSVSPSEGGSFSMQLPLKMESSTEEESWLEDQWEKW